MKKFFLILALSGYAIFAHAQQKYWIIFADKPAVSLQLVVSPQAVQNRQQLALPAQQPTDAPVFQPYLAQLNRYGIQPLCTSKWLNGVSAYLDEDQLANVRLLPFVREIHSIDRRLRISSSVPPGKDAEYYAAVMTQTDADAFVQAGLTGKNVKIGVIDVGFYGLYASKSVQHVARNNQIADIKDYVNPNKVSHFTEMETESDYHGATVIQMIAGYDAERKLRYGMAKDAQFYLARTDHGTVETRSEEDNWIAAIERMDSLGVRLVNTSLGYALGFTNPAENYEPSQMNGKTSLISRAARIASEEKGMLIVVSAGNEGSDPDWRIVSTPADAESVLSVGATESRSRSKAGYSSIGPDFLPYLKPNVACYSASGTSFSAPVITGFAACLMEKNPKLTNRQLMRIIEKSAHLYPYGNNYVGFGIPSATKALQLLADSTLDVNNTEEVHVSDNSFNLDVASSVDRVVLFHKANTYFVVKQEIVPVRKDKLVVKRPADASRTTVDMGNKVVEIFWESGLSERAE